jgi:hypothetical protein
VGVFHDILSKIFPANHPSVAAAATGATAPETPAPRPASSGTTVTPTPAAASSSSSSPVDVEAVLNGLAAKNPEKLNWRTSIVDLMKLVGIDSSLSARKRLADELNYNGDSNDSAAMNMWLHRQVMKKMAENGGKVPEDLKQ